MATNHPHFDGEILRRSRSTGDLPTGHLRRPERVRISPNHRYSESHARSTDRASSSRSVAFDDHPRADPSSIGHRSPISAARRPWSPPPTVNEDPDEEPAVPHPGLPVHPPPQQYRSLYGKTLAFFGYGRNASRARRAFVSLIWNLGWGLVQVSYVPLCHSGPRLNFSALSR
jgi:hypothetical protein